MIDISAKEYLRLRQIALFVPTSKNVFTNDSKNDDSHVFRSTEIYYREIRVFIKLREIHEKFKELLDARDIDTYEEKKIVGGIKRYIAAHPQDELQDFINSNFCSPELSKNFYYYFSKILRYYSFAELSQHDEYLKYIFDCVQVMCAFARKNDDIDEEIDKLSHFLEKNQTNHTTWNKEIFYKIILEYSELYHKTHSMLTKYRDIPEAIKKELCRREKISHTKRDQNSERRKKIDEICKSIREKSNRNKTSISTECKKYFGENKILLQELHISSPRTLGNHCSSYVPNLQRANKNAIFSHKPLSEGFCDEILQLPCP